MSRTILYALVMTIAAACGGKSSPPTAPAPGTDEPHAERRQLSADECEAEGGTVVGDIGDGATHRPDYRCPDNGEPPIGNVVADPGAPMAIEGAVCCR